MSGTGEVTVSSRKEEGEEEEVVGQTFASIMQEAGVSEVARAGFFIRIEDLWFRSETIYFKRPELKDLRLVCTVKTQKVIRK